MMVQKFWVLLKSRWLWWRPRFSSGGQKLRPIHGNRYAYGKTSSGNRTPTLANA